MPRCILRCSGPNPRGILFISGCIAWQRRRRASNPADGPTPPAASRTLYSVIHALSPCQTRWPWASLPRGRRAAFHVLTLVPVEDSHYSLRTPCKRSESKQRAGSASAVLFLSFFSIFIKAYVSIIAPRDVPAIAHRNQTETFSSPAQLATHFCCGCPKQSYFSRSTQCPFP